MKFEPLYLWCDFKRYKIIPYKQIDLGTFAPAVHFKVYLGRRWQYFKTFFVIHDDFILETYRLGQEPIFKLRGDRHIIKNIKFELRYELKEELRKERDRTRNRRQQL